MFSWDRARAQAIKITINRSHLLAGGGATESIPNPDFAIAHPDWVREAKLKNFTVMDKKITLQMKDFQNKAIERRMKNAPTK